MFSVLLCFSGPIIDTKIEEKDEIVRKLAFLDLPFTAFGLKSCRGVFEGADHGCDKRFANKKKCQFCFRSSDKVWNHIALKGQIWRGKWSWRGPPSRAFSFYLGRWSSGGRNTPVEAYTGLLPAPLAYLTNAGGFLLLRKSKVEAVQWWTPSTPFPSHLQLPLYASLHKRGRGRSTIVHLQNVQMRRNWKLPSSTSSSLKSSLFIDCLTVEDFGVVEFTEAVPDLGVKNENSELCLFADILKSSFL